MTHRAFQRAHRSLCLAFAIAFGAFSSCAGHAQSAAAARSGYTIAGRVLNASTGTPVPQASVSALGEQDSHVIASCRTDADGHFVLPGLPAGKYPLTASKRGYRTAYYDEHEEFNSAIVTGEGQDTQHLEFQLAPAAVLTGVVTGDDGEAIEGASVMLFRHAGTAGPAQRTAQMEVAMTDDTGSYEFANLPAGNYAVAVKATPWFALHSQANRTYNASGTDLDVAYPITFYDSTIDEASASSIALAAGSREEANITLHAVPALHLTLPRPARPGAIPVQLRQTVFGTPIDAHGTDRLFFQQGTVDVSGLAPGHYELTHGDPPRSLEIDASTDVAVDANAGSPLVSVSGTLRDSTGVLLEGACELRLRPVTNSTARLTITAIAQGGRFRFEAMPPGEWSISVLDPAQGTLLPTMSIAVGTRVLSGDQFMVGEQPLRIDVRVSRSRTRVQGFARKGDKAAPGAMIVLVAREPSAYLSRLRRDQSDSDGSFSLRDVPPGQYTAIAIQDGWKLDWQDRESMARYLSRGVPITVTEGAASVLLPKPVPATPRQP